MHNTVGIGRHGRRREREPHPALPEDGEGFYRGFTSGTESRIRFAILEGDELCEGKAEVQKSSC